MIAPNSVVTLIPESAPFNEEQRAWLNGFLAGWLGIETTGASDSAVNQLIEGIEASHRRVTPTSSTGPVSDSVAAEDFPWHDPSLPLADRRQLAAGRPYARRLMSAMAQLNCGACGYVCQTYAEAIADGSERNLMKCSPGGKETAKALKDIKAAEKSGSETVVTATPQAAMDTMKKVTAPSSGLAAAKVARSADYQVRLKSVRNLNGRGSQKHTSHVVLDLTSVPLTYRVGDSLGVHPQNCPDLVAKIIEAAGLAGDDAIRYDGKSTSLAEGLATCSDLHQVDEGLCELANFPSEIDVDECDVLDFLQLGMWRPVTAQDFIDRLLPLRPRLYSISSSLGASPQEVHLTVARVVTERRGRERKGVASTMFSDRLCMGDSLRVFVQPGHDFTLPADPTTPLIMIGPGTGIAPFRAFLQERALRRDPGPNWLFFGDQCAATDFLYESELRQWQEQGLLTRLDVAFSRDQPEKVYVQHKMQAVQDEIFRWLQQGAVVCVCGDAKRMAVDVDGALHKIICQAGRMSEADARAYVQQMRSQQRYLRDVY